MTSSFARPSWSTPSILGLLLNRFSWNSFFIGAGTALFGGIIARPVLVEAVKLGMDVQDYAGETMDRARTEYQKVRAEAAARRAGPPAQLSSAELLAEIQKLHEEIASLRGAVASSGATKKAP